MMTASMSDRCAFGETMRLLATVAIPYHSDLLANLLKSSHRSDLPSFGSIDAGNRFSAPEGAASVSVHLAFVKSALRKVLAPFTRPVEMSRRPMPRLLSVDSPDRRESASRSVRDEAPRTGKSSCDYLSI